METIRSIILAIFLTPICIGLIISGIDLIVDYLKNHLDEGS